MQTLIELLKAAVNAFNEIPNKKLHGKFKDTYSIASAIDKELRKQDTRPALPDFCPAAANRRDITGTEYQPTRYINEDSEVERCKPDEADQHSVYILDGQSHAHCIADFATKEQAENFQCLIDNIIKNLKTAPPKDNGFNNGSFRDAVETEFMKYSNLSYSLEKDEDTDTWQLTINSTSSSELDGSDEGYLADYSYSEAREAIEDLQTAEARYSIHFDEI